MKQTLRRLCISALAVIMMLVTFLNNIITTSATMQPIEERSAYLILRDVDLEQLKEYPVTSLISGLRYSDGTNVEVSDSDKLIWSYVVDTEKDTVIHDEYHVIERDEVIDLSYFAKYPEYTLELIIGDGNQLSENNKRYFVKVVFFGFEGVFSYDFAVYQQGSDGSRTEIKSNDIVKTRSSKDLGTKEQPNVVQGVNYWYVMEPGDYSNIYLSMHSVINDRPDVALHIFELVVDEQTQQPYLGEEITDQLLYADMSQPNSGYRITSAEMMFVVYYEIEGIDRYPADVTYTTLFLVGSVPHVTPDLFKSGDATKTSVVRESDEQVELIAPDEDIYHFELELNKEASAEEELMLNLTAINGDLDLSGQVVKAVEGLYTNLADAEACEDIKDLLFSDTTGYPAVFSGDGVDITVFFDDGTFSDTAVYRLNIKAKDAEKMREYTDEPIVGERDPWFRVTGMMLYNPDTNEYRQLDTYVVENGKAINMDTYYGYGYQTVMINEVLTDEQMKNLAPVFELADEDRLKVISARGQQDVIESGKTVMDFTIPDQNTGETGLVKLLLDFDDKTHVKNYQLRVIAKQSGPSLYVYDDNKEIINDKLVRSREVMLTEHFEYKHDILIANMGDQPLTNLKVELKPAYGASESDMHVKLDKYWSIGDDGNNTLMGFTKTKDMSAYGMIPSVAKIRLLPEGTGEINAKLVITADGQEPVEVYLTNHAKQPTIINDKLTLPDGVKWVPYSAYIVTDNMYDWNAQTFSIAEEDKLNEEYGLKLYPGTGEIYGVPKKSTADEPNGVLELNATVSFSKKEYFEDQTVVLKLLIQENEDVIVYEASDEGMETEGYNYAINIPLGMDETGDRHFIIDDISNDLVFESDGNVEDFVQLWLNGELLTAGTDYIYEPGSTRVTIRSQTFDGANKGNTKEGRNTIAMEFRNKKGGPTDDHSKDLRRTSQNFYIVEKEVTPTPPQPVLPANVTIHGNIIDENNNPMAGVLVELHSTVRTANTDSKGNVTFSAVEYGDHTAYVKDSSGKELGVSKFTLVEGSNAGRSGDVITAPRGADVNITIKISSDGKASIEEAEVVNTADSNRNGTWTFGLVASLLVIAAAIIVRKRTA